MKMITRAFLFAVAFMASAAAMAAGTAVTSGAPITNTDCTLLGETVTLNLSSNVFGAYQCIEIDNEIKVATCHKAGSRKATSLPCQVVGTDPGTGASVYNNPACTGATGETFEIADYRGFIASSTGGSVGTTDLGGNCTAATVGGLAHFN
ncbi:MAG: hypothetical protein OEZ16_09905 [Chromatiales bacterium]|nr:hypothetical protein [Chromatiales bacterium]